MAAISVTRSRVAAVFENRSDVRSYIAGGTIDYGDPVYINTSDGKVYASAGDEAGTAVVCGYSLGKVGAGQAVDVMHRGQLAGYDVSALDYGAAVYIADGGGLDTAAGTVSRVGGRVNGISDASVTKIIEVDFDLSAVTCYGAGPA
ncbi:MAG: hypothetical protein ACFE0Q_20845 [Anaerolineae bacterium]